MSAMTNKRQRKSVQYFSRFVIQNDKKVKQDLIKEDIGLNKLISGFDPEEDLYDRRILYEITGRKIN